MWLQLFSGARDQLRNGPGKVLMQLAGAAPGSLGRWWAMAAQQLLSADFLGHRSRAWELEGHRIHWNPLKATDNPWNPPSKKPKVIGNGWNGWNGPGKMLENGWHALNPPSNWCHEVFQEPEILICETSIMPAFIEVSSPGLKLMEIDHRWREREREYKVS